MKTSPKPLVGVEKCNNDQRFHTPAQKVANQYQTCCAEKSVQSSIESINIYLAISRWYFRFPFQNPNEKFGKLAHLHPPPEVDRAL